MSEPRAHEPKIAALHAYADGALRPAGRARIERHLDRCATCTEALRGLQRLRQLAAPDLDRPELPELPAIDWMRVESALQREATRLVRRRRMRAAVSIGVGLAAAVWLALVLTRTPPAPRVAVKRPQPVAAAAATAPTAIASLRAAITAVVGDAVAIDAANGRSALTLDSHPSEGWTLETRPGGEVHVAVPGTAAFALRSDSQVDLRVLRDGAVELALERGAIVSQVDPRLPGQRYEILAGGRRVRVHGTRFAVEIAPGSLAVQVDEGAVQVLDGDGTLLAELRAPRRWVQDTTATAGHTQRIAARLPRPRRAAADGAEWPVLAIPTWPAIAQWQIDGADVPASGELRMRVPPGKLQLIGRLGDGRSMRAEVSVDALGARFDPSALRFAPSTAGVSVVETPSDAPLDSTSASAVIRNSQPELQRCYERSMRSQADDAASIVRVRLRIEIDARGSVHAVDLVGAEAAPADLAACVRRVARGWRFAAPGGTGVMFEAPLRFRPLH